MGNILDYLRMTIDAQADIQRWNAKESLNLQLAGSYEYYLTSMLSVKFLMIKPLDEFAISKTKIHMIRIQEKTGYQVALLLQTTSAYKVKKLFEEKMAFVTVDKQMYLPFLALHVKLSREREIDILPRERFTAATQMVYLSVLYSSGTTFTTEELAKKLNVSDMTILRSMEELKRLGIVEQEIGGKTGRKKIYTPINKKEYYQIGKEYLINPVKKCFYVKFIPEALKVYQAGISALANQTMLGEPDHMVFATYEKQKGFSEYIVTKAQALSESLPEIQMMQYDIEKLTENQYIDPISLIMSITKKDDRIEIAIDELMEGAAWYEE